MSKALLFVQADVDADQREEWNRWYNDKHVPDLLSRPGISTGRRFERAREDGIGLNGPLQQYLAVYDLEGVGALQTEEYRAIRQPPIYTDQDRAMLRQFRNTNRGVFEQIGEWCTEGADPLRAGAALAVGLVPEDGYDEEYNAWYDEEHIPALLPVDGVLRVRRYRAVEGEPRYLALWELAAPEVRFSPAFQEKADSPWSSRMRRHCTRRLTGVYRAMPLD